MNEAVDILIRIKNSAISNHQHDTVAKCDRLLLKIVTSIEEQVDEELKNG